MMEHNAAHPTISFIVPAYNVHRYLDACVQSLVEASQEGDEIIIVNDGSTDATGQLCEKWAKQHPRLIKMIDQHNQGLSAARNNALQLATCAYVLFMDSDDVIIPSCVQRARSILQSDAPDITVMDFFWWIPERQDERNRSPICSHPINSLALDRDAFNIETFSDVLLSACSRIFKHTLLKQLGPQVFPIGQAYEEIATVPRLTLRAKSIYYLNEALFDYRIRPGSITQSKTAKHCLDLSKALTVAIGEIRSQGLSPEVELSANMTSAKLLMTAIRDGGLVSNRPKSLYQDILEFGYKSFSLPAEIIESALRTSPDRANQRTARHLHFSRKIPSLFIASRKMVYWLKRRRLEKHLAR